MPLKQFDHVNIITANLEAMVEWYDRVLGMSSGPRPAFSFPGAWLYIGDQAVVHLVGSEQEPETKDPKIEHFAFSAEGLETFRLKLAEQGIEAREAEVPGFGILQLNIHDPDGNHIHIDFDIAQEGN